MNIKCCEKCGKTSYRVLTKWEKGDKITIHCCNVYPHCNPKISHPVCPIAKRRE